MQLNWVGFGKIIGEKSLNSQKVEEYFVFFEKTLGHLPVRDRAEVLLFAQNKFQEELRSNGENFNLAYSKFGTPKKYSFEVLKEMGKSFSYPKKSRSLWPWGLLLFFSLLFIGGAGFIYWKFTPLYSVDDQTGRLKFFGDTIDILPGEITTFIESESQQVSFEGKEILNHRGVDFFFGSGIVNFYSADTGELSYKCKSNEDLSSQILNPKEVILFNFENKSIYCDLWVPETSLIRVKGNNGIISIKKIPANIDIKLGNGSLNFTPKEGELYAYHLEVSQGTIGEFSHSTDLNAYQIKAKVDKGMILNKEK